MALTHGDIRGLVIPPRVSEIHVIIIPVGVTAKTTSEEKEKLYNEIDALSEVLRSANVRVGTDMREGYSPGWKFNDWELKGIPLRIEFGPKDSARHVVTTPRRDIDSKDEARSETPISELKDAIPALLDTIQVDMFKKADDAYRAHRVQVTDWKDFVPTLNGKNFVLVPHCEGGKCEDEIKEMSARKKEGDNAAEDTRAPAMGARSLCIPFGRPKGIVQGETKCMNPI